MQPGEALAREAIRDTLARYNLAGDRGRLDDVLACFARDGVLEIDGEPACRGHAAIRERLGRAAEALSSGSSRPLLRHHLTTSAIELEGGAARAWSYFLAVAHTGPDHSGRYVDRLRREEDRWLLVHRRVAVDWTSGRSAFPDLAGR